MWNIKNRMRIRASIVVTAVSLILSGCQTGVPKVPDGPVDTLRPAKTDALAPGLAVEYSNIIANSISDVKIAGRGTPGPKLPHLNWNHSDTPVMTSQYATEVAAQINGYMLFDTAGTYVLKVKSNDGVRLSLDGVLLINDPTVHASRFAPPSTLVIKEPGHYRLDMLYYQKRGTAALEVYWQPPGATDFVIVPDSAFFHSATD